ncbi:hypothetical protein NV379_22820 [Paenibacillus sp. N1-5-1-14]|uniref:hypothetical protein n=1 Tax=Paenibacillus radicibacter TaxID=2972488 RepID=UPI002158D4F9|nr:hypothetical protein [Paenibacillus radicibacter]MCR8645474.1 hypothetical protein [Paenibacillus radicibacter]
MKKRHLIFMFAFLTMVILLTGCVPGDGANNAQDHAGFFWGIWHGWIAPISLIIGLFNHDIRVYETFNSGWWYDFGFYIAIISGFGGLSLFRRKKSNRD